MDVKCHHCGAPVTNENRLAWTHVESGYMTCSSNWVSTHSQGAPPALIRGLCAEPTHDLVEAVDELDMLIEDLGTLT